MEWSIPALKLATLVPLTVIIVDVVRRLVHDRVERKGYPLPPGPMPLPLFGSALSVDMQESFRTYTEWRAKYGDIMYLRLLDVDILVLSSPSVATDLLEKRSNVYSDRPFLATLDPYGHDVNFGFARYGDHWRLCRRIFHQTFRADTVTNFHPIQVRKAHELVLSLMNDPIDYKFHYLTFSAGVTMRSVYDYDPISPYDPFVFVMNHFLEASFPALLPEKAALFKLFPFLLHIPDGLPGARIKHEARLARELSERAVEEPYQHVQKRMRSNEDSSSSMVSEHISRLENFDPAYRSQYEIALKQTSATAYLASMETTATTLMIFTLAMVQNPHVWKRAQADIDAVVGIDRLPEFDDRSFLPYVDAILRETLRWQPPVPLFLRATTSSDIYNGFYIPKGATVIGNVWAMSRDEIRYPNPEKFHPERFLDAQEELIDDTPDFVFGFGRRNCPGRYNANATLWIAMVTMLATFEFNRAKDVDGKDVEFEAKFVNGITRHPLPFPCHIIPRSHVEKKAFEQALNNSL